MDLLNKRDELLIAFPMYVQARDETKVKVKKEKHPTPIVQTQQGRLYRKKT